VTLAYPFDKLREEIAFIAYHLHWSMGELLSLPHRERVEWVGQVSKINKRIIESEN
jgi:hypothetical protein